MRTLPRCTPTFLVVVAATLLLCPTTDAEVRDSDSLWFSTDEIDGEPKLTSFDVPIGSIQTLYLWLEVDPGAGYDVATIYFPIALDAPGETHVEIGAPGGSAWDGNTGSVAGTIFDPDLNAAAPFSTWTNRALFEKTYPANGDTTQLLAAFAQSTTAGEGWSGKAQVGSFTLTGTGIGTTVFDLAEHPLTGGGAAGAAIADPTGVNVWQPVMIPLTVNVTDLTDVVVNPGALAFRLHPVFPSPVNEQGTVRFDLPQPAMVSLVLYDGRGRRLSTVEGSSLFPAGRHEKTLKFFGIRPGTYFLRMTVLSPESGAVLHRTSQKIVHIHPGGR